MHRKLHLIECRARNKLNLAQFTIWRLTDLIFEVGVSRNKEPTNIIAASHRNDISNTFSVLNVRF